MRIIRISRHPNPSLQRNILLKEMIRTWDYEGEQSVYIMAGIFYFINKEKRPMMHSSTDKGSLN
jgi:hypothetical protein